MPRKQFLEDFAACQRHSFPSVVDIRAGEEAGTLIFSYLSHSLPVGFLNIQVLIPEIYDYPTSHDCIVFVDQDANAPQSLTTALGDVHDSLSGKTLSQILYTVSELLSHALTKGDASNPIDLDADSPPKRITTKGNSASPYPRKKYIHSENEDNISDEDGDYDGYEDEGEEYNDDDNDDNFFGDTSQPESVSTSANKATCSGSDTATWRMREDLRAAKEAGFKVGILGNLHAGGILCISIRVVKLGISEEAMQAWGLHRKHYLVLLLRFEDGYRTLEQIVELPRLEDKTQVRVALCRHYKPRLADALSAFTVVSKPDHISVMDQVTRPKNMSEIQNQAARSAKPADATNETHSTERSSPLEALFIGRPLNELFRTRFASVTRYRLACAFSWTGAELFVHDIQAKVFDDTMISEPKYNVPEILKNRQLPNIVTADAMEGVMGRKVSLPLVAMQFLLRHFVRCTEFCLVCHCKVEDTFEALKPYVCSNPLCLYQYMGLGFGPSVEWEIMSQPYVVDLLVSFCYTSARQGRLKDFPSGVDIKVPFLPHFVQKTYSQVMHPASTTAQDQRMPEPPTPSFTAKYDHLNQEIILSATSGCPVKQGDWLVLNSKKLEVRIHCHVEDTTYFPCVKIGKTISVPTNLTENNDYGGVARSTSTPDASPKVMPAGTFAVDCFKYDQSLDALSDQHKRQAITTLLDTIPNTKTMQDRMDACSQGQEPNLRKAGLSESALNLLRWIIASNRSCIMQIDRTLDKHLGTTPIASRSAIGGAEDRVTGMEGWMQFRFAQGAPDKEQRFMDCVNQVGAVNNPKHPTLFAWHGSPLSNWHSIVREGLHFNETLHGRAYGHGVYMSPQAMTSMGYSRMYTGGYAATPGADTWPNSNLRVSTALSLNEVVNCPDKFTCRTPHYVVNKIEWIQTRYLFVKPADTTIICAPKRPKHVHVQDPSACVFDEKNHAIEIPITAVSKSRRPAMSPEAQHQNGGKRAKSLFPTNQQTAENVEDDANSVVSDIEDRYFLEADERAVELAWMEQGTKTNTNAKRTTDTFLQEDTMDWQAEVGTTGPSVSIPPKTDFVPGALDVSEIKMLKEPKDASTRTTKALMRALQEALKVQDSTALHELGWFIDRANISNLYQWIVELHSFDSALPLARDMKKAKSTSVVLELRFTNEFPFAPPFVRVIRPRFLPFLAGGGGHVTAGGAICMQLLTSDGWMVTNTIESLLLQIRMAVSSLDPHPARLETAGYNGISYGVGEAIDAFKRACLAHGWRIPSGFDSLQQE